MWKSYGYLIILVTILHHCNGQDPTTTTPATPTVSQNVSVNPSQIINFKIPGGRLLGLLTLLTSLKGHFGGGFMGRCLGAARKLKFIMPFLLYKLGVIVTTLGFLVLFALKGLTIGVILLVLNAGGWLGKIAFTKGAFFGNHYGGGGGGHHHGWHGKHHGPPVHIHVHKDRNDHHGHDNYISYSPPPGYGGTYDSYTDAGRTGSIGGSGPDYDPAAASSWSERISKGFNVNDIISNDLKRSGINVAYPRRVSPTLDTNPIR